MTAAVAVSSASGLLSLLEEEDEGLRLHALQSLNSVVHEYWYQIASSIASVEAFYEDEEFKHRELAALVASKVRLAALGSAHCGINALGRQQSSSLSL